jgi:hypothetical protein
MEKMNRQEILGRALRAVEIVTNAPTSASFAEIIESDRAAFAGLKIVYASQHVNSEFLGVQFAKIEHECPLVQRLFGGQGLLFFTDEIYRRTKAGETQVNLDFSVSFDANVAEAIRCLVAHKGISRPDDLQALIYMLKIRKPRFNFDYSPFLLENMEHDVPGNDRPSTTLAALKRLDYLNCEQYARMPMLPMFVQTEKESIKVARDLLDEFHANQEAQRQIERRKTVYLVLLFAMLCRWEDRAGTESNLGKVICFCLEHIGKFPRKEIYFAWKLLLNDAALPVFFQPVSSPRSDALEKLRGMSWDIFLLRWLETVSTKDDRGDFYIPFIATYDGKYKKLIEACPIRAIVMCPSAGFVHTIFFDDVAFGEVINSACSEEIKIKLSNPTLKQARIDSAPVSVEEIDSMIQGLEYRAMMLVD